MGSIVQENKNNPMLWVGGIVFLLVGGRTIPWIYNWFKTWFIPRKSTRRNGIQRFVDLSNCCEGDSIGLMTMISVLLLSLLGISFCFSGKKHTNRRAARRRRRKSIRQAKDFAFRHRQSIAEPPKPPLLAVPGAAPVGNVSRAANAFPIPGVSHGSRLPSVSKTPATPKSRIQLFQERLAVARSRQALSVSPMADESRRPSGFGGFWPNKSLRPSQNKSPNFLMIAGSKRPAISQLSR